MSARNDVSVDQLAGEDLIGSHAQVVLEALPEISDALLAALGVAALHELSRDVEALKASLGHLQAIELHVVELTSR